MTTETIHKFHSSQGDEQVSNARFDQHKEISKAFSFFDFSHREVEIYLALLQNGGMKASELARRFGMQRFDTYNILKKMQSKQIVEVTVSKPMFFRAVPPDDVLQGIRSRNREELNEKFRALSKLEETLKSPSFLAAHRSKIKTADDNKIQFLSGKKSVRERWTKLIRSAEKEILLVAVENGITQSLIFANSRMISDKIGSGVAVHIFTPITNVSNPRIKGIKDRVRNLTSLASAGLCVVDQYEAMILVESSNRDRKSPGRDDGSAIVINGQSIIEMLRTLFFEGWNTSSSVGRAFQDG